MKLFSFLLFSLFSLTVNAQGDLPVSWKASTKKINTETANIIVNAKMQTGWVLYGIDNESASPISTKIIIDGAQTIDDITSVPAPTKEYDTVMEQEMIKHKLPTTFTQKVKFNNNNNNNNKASVSITYMACNSKSCLPPTTEVLTVDFK